MKGNDNADDDSMFRIDTCSPQELVNALRAARGENETIAFLHAALAVSPGDAKIGNENSCGGYELGDECRQLTENLSNSVKRCHSS